MGDWGPRLTSFSAGILADGFGLEVVIVSLAATIDEGVASIVFLAIPPTTKKSHAGTSFFW
jgi:hypothetical protein